MQENVLMLENVSKHYWLGDSVVKAAQDINLTIRKGEFVALVGPSGSGKSTIMNLIGALDSASGGRILLDNQDINSFSESELAQMRGKKIGFVFQTFNLIPTLSAFENVEMPMMFQSIPRNERKEKAKKLLEQVGLGHRLKHLPNELSGGERQRVAIARALANNPDILLADEPTGNLDAKTGKAVVDILRHLNKEGKTIILVTHNAKIAKLANRIIRIEDGRISK